MKRASDDAPDDWSPLLGSVNHVDRILDERPLCAKTGPSTNVARGPERTLKERRVNVRLDLFTMLNCLRQPANRIATSD
jgi:hypothetical protein